MNESQRRAWAALELGPQWQSRHVLVDEPSAVASGARSDPAVTPGMSMESGSSSPHDWGSLRAAVAQCQACGLCRTRRQTVFGSGSETARWMLVGEAPGAEEDQHGEAFVGQAGRLLDQMLQSLGLSRERDVFIANTLKCRPPENRNPAPDELVACRPFLRQQFELLQPSVILLLGRFAAQEMLQTTEGIGALRGRVHEVRLGERAVPAVVTYHPAYLLRTPQDKARAWQDLCLARSVLARTG